MYRGIESLVNQAHDENASDIHLVAGYPPRCRIDGRLVNMDNALLLAEDCERYARDIAGEKIEHMKVSGEADSALTINNIRCRANVFRAQGAASVALRLLSDRIPDIGSLGLPGKVREFSLMKQGIVLVTGETGSGKSTTLAAVLNEINNTRNDHIITLEDPIEYVYGPARCIVNQREVGRDTESYEAALRAVLREDPDVILIGEMRDQASIETALTAAETGHLVFSTLHTKSAAESIDRIVGNADSSRAAQIRNQLSTTLNAVLSQQLLPKKGGGRVPACELMIVTPAIRNLIREAKTPQIAGSIATGSEYGSITMDNSILKLYRQGLISNTTAIEAASDRKYVEKALHEI